jgi:hypothetical protein
VDAYSAIEFIWRDGTGWFRVYGYGLQIADKTRYQPLFSEREGYVKWWRIGKWGICILKPRKEDKLRGN